MSTDYSSSFDPVDYLKARWEGIPTASYIRYNIANFLIQFYQDIHRQLDTTSIQLLELAGGPALGNIIGAGPYVSKITFTDYLPSNVEQVALWKEKSPKAFNWDSVFQHVVKETVGEEADITAIAANWQEQLRKKITTLGHCDFTREGFIDPSLIPAGGFDVLVTSGSLESVAKNEADLTAMLKTCHSLLREGGFLAVAIFGKASTYQVNPDDDKNIFYNLYLTEEIARKALTEAGFTIERFKLLQNNQSELVPNECYWYVARKT